MNGKEESGQKTIVHSNQVPLTAQEQWHNFIAHHEGQWQGHLIRYSGTGKLLDRLDSIRRFTASDDRSSFIHALDFRSRITGDAIQKQWDLTAGDPLIIHPVDPTAYLLFNPVPVDVMVGHDRMSLKTFYFEPYLITGNQRVSLVVMYKQDSPQPTAFSLFREVKQGTESPGWMEGTNCAIESIAQFRLPVETETGIYVTLNEMTQTEIGPRSWDAEGEFLHIRFPDHVELFVTPNRFETPYYASMRWQAAPHETTRICTLIYRQADQLAELWAV